MNPVAWACALAIAIAVVARPRPPVRIPGRVATLDVDPAVPKARSGTASMPRRRHATTTIEVAEWCEAIARAVRGGDTLALAFGSTPPPAAHARLVDQLALHLARTGSLGELPPDASQDLTLVLAVVATCLEHGGPAAEPLDRAASVLRARAADRADREIHSAQARLSAQVLTVLPVAMLALLLTTSHAVRSAVVTPVGIVVVAIGAVVNLVGWRWMRRIIQRAAR